MAGTGTRNTAKDERTQTLTASCQMSTRANAVITVHKYEPAAYDEPAEGSALTRLAGKVVAEITAAGGAAIAAAADISVRAEYRAMVDQMLAGCGRWDILVNNAAVAITKPFGEITEAEFDLSFAVNVKGVFHGLQLAWEHLADGGRIITISSSTTALMLPGYAVYDATKGAVEQFTHILSKEFGHYETWRFVVEVRPAAASAYRAGVEQKIRVPGFLVPAVGHTVRVEYHEKDPDKVELALQGDDRYDIALSDREAKERQKAGKASRDAAFQAALDAPPRDPECIASCARGGCRARDRDRNRHLVSECGSRGYLDAGGGHAQISCGREPDPAGGGAAGRAAQADQCGALFILRDRPGHQSRTVRSCGGRRRAPPARHVVVGDVLCSRRH